MPKGQLLFMPEPLRTASGRKRTPRPASPKKEPIPGLTYVPRYVTEPIEAFLLARIDAEPWRNDLQRRTQHYGWLYDFKARRIDRSMYLGPLPAWLQPLAGRLAADRHMDTVPDQVIVNECVPGQGIQPHIDCAPCFGATICSISLGSACIMDFTSRAHAGATTILLQRGSLLALDGEARYRWKHGIAKRKTDTIAGNTRKRGRRVSLTFRTVSRLG